MTTKSNKIAKATTATATAKADASKAARKAKADARRDALAKLEAQELAANQARVAECEAKAAERVAYFTQNRAERESAKAAEGRADAAAFVGTVKLGAVNVPELERAGYTAGSAKVNASVWNLGAKAAEAIGEAAALQLIAQLEAAPQVGAIRTRDRIAKGLRMVKDAAKEAGGKLSPEAAKAACEAAVNDAGTIKPRGPKDAKPGKAEAKPVTLEIAGPGDVARVLAAIYATAVKMSAPSKDAAMTRAWADTLSHLGKAAEAGAPLR